MSSACITSGEPLVMPRILAISNRGSGPAGRCRSGAGLGQRHLSHQEHSYLACSRYEQQLVLRSEDLYAGRLELWARLLALLELDLWSPPAPGAANAGAGEALAVPAELEPTYAAMAREYGIRWQQGGGHTP